jgi:Protein of unknown function (DUF3365)
MGNRMIRMLTSLATALAASLAVSAIAMAADETTSSDALASQARGIVSQFSEKLKSELVRAIEAGGPVKAIEVCNVIAPAIASEASIEGWSVGRTSLKLRNAKSKPDDWEKQTLEHFEAEKARGADVSMLERSEIVNLNGVRTFRFMKAIPTAEPCLTCHGGAVKEPVKAKLAELYPEDQAMGFSLGDIRGAFTLSKPAQ